MAWSNKLTSTRTWFRVRQRCGRKNRIHKKSKKSRQFSIQEKRVKFKVRSEQSVIRIFLCSRPIAILFPTPYCIWETTWTGTLVLQYLCVSEVYILRHNSNTRKKYVSLSIMIFQSKLNSIDEQIAIKFLLRNQIEIKKNKKFVSYSFLFLIIALN